VRNLEVAVQSWKALVTQYQQGSHLGVEHPRAEIRL
jgi:hypothetical protein